MSTIHSRLKQLCISVAFGRAGCCGLGRVDLREKLIARTCVLTLVCPLYAAAAVRVFPNVSRRVELRACSSIPGCRFKGKHHKDPEGILYHLVLVFSPSKTILLRTYKT